MKNKQLFYNFMFALAILFVLALSGFYLITNREASDAVCIVKVIYGDSDLIKKSGVVYNDNIPNITRMYGNGMQG